MSQKKLKLLSAGCLAILAVGFWIHAFWPKTIIHEEKLSLFLRADRTLSFIHDEKANTNEIEQEIVVSQSDFPFKTELIGVGHEVKVSWRNQRGENFSANTEYDIDNPPAFIDLSSGTNDFSMKLKFKLPPEAMEVLVENRWNWKRFFRFHGKMVILPGNYVSEVSKSDWVPVSSLKPYNVGKRTKLESKPFYAGPPMGLESQAPACCGSIPHKSPCLENLRYHSY